MHRHHLKPKHRGGTDDDGIVEVSVIQHAMFHWCEYQLHGQWQDRLAWQALTKQIGREEAQREAARQSSLNREWSDESREKARQAKLGRTFSHKEMTKIKIGISNAKPIRCQALETTFSSCSEAARNLGIHVGSISGMLCGNRKKVRWQGQWLTFEYLNS